MADRDPQPPRAALSRERVLRAAVELADRGGIDSLTMRQLGERLGAGAMSIYHHVPGKEALLDGMVDIVFGEIDVPPASADWRDALRRRAISTRAALRRHPWAIGLMESRAQPGPANLRQHNAVLACLREAGFSVPDAVHAYSVQDAYIYGFALGDRSLFETSAQAARAGEAMVERFRHLAAELPYSYEVVGGYVARGGYDPDAEFEFGLDLILDALGRILEPASAPRRRRPGARRAGA